MWPNIRSIGRKLLIILCMVMLFLVACGEQGSIEQDHTGGEASTEEARVEVLQGPAEVVSVVDTGPVIPETTRVLSQETAGEVLPAITVTDSSLTFSSQALAEAGFPDFQVQVNEVLVVDPVEGAPNGMLRRVTAVSRDANGDLVAETVPASLTEAIQTGTIKGSYEGEVLSFRAPGRAMGPAKMRAAKYKDVPIDKTVAGVHVVGSVRITPGFDIEIDIDNYKLEKFEFVDTTRVSGRLEATAQLEGVHFEEPYLLTTISLSPTPIDVSDTILDVWFTPAVNVYVGAEGDITTSLTAFVEQDLTMYTRLVYPGQNGDFEMKLDPKIDKQDYDVSNFSADSELMAYVRTELTVQVFEFGGPYTGVDAFLKLDVDTVRDPLWQLFWGLRGNVGAELKFLGFTITKWDSELFYKEWPITQGGAPAPAASEPPEPAETEEPPEPPPPEPAETEEPTEAPPPPVPTTALPPPDVSANVYMVYEDNAATLINNASGTISLLDVTFQRISDQGEVTAEFPSSFWGHAYSEKPITALPPGDCFIVSKSSFSLPGECSSVWSWFTTSGEQFYFWSSAPGSNAFQVLKGDQVVGTCDINVGSCSFSLPQP